MHSYYHYYVPRIHAFDIMQFASPYSRGYASASGSFFRKLEQTNEMSAKVACEATCPHIDTTIACKECTREEDNRRR